ncbi:ABC transporter substrate-binding protein [Elioraea tepidiphila]|jgi:ABC-type glycerol-3-phosphate transport system substrate-binding protein|uniref:ABC transporter substrate-binding protein n=1 Tax=Elioraea tepidiphila TaxID=457934 RepID=UPI000362E427|nr:extracellular solute-binding protein [Elioraea tepidiphila]
MLGRRSALKASVALAASLATPAIAQTRRRISFLTWNIIDQEPLIRGWIESFQRANPGAEVEWLDKKGPELPPFYQTQLAAGTPPDVINTQGALWLEYAANGALMDLTEAIAGDPAVKSRFNAEYLANWTYQGRNFMVPFYITKTLLFYNKPLFQQAGLSGPPGSFDDILGFADRIKGGDRTGFLTLNFDWLYWPLFAMNGIELLTPDLKKTAFNTPKAAEVVEKLARASDSGAINKISWTGRWVEPNGAFGAGNVGMLHAHSPAYYFFRGQGTWVTPESLGVAHAPGGYSTPNSHGLGVSKGSRHPDLAVAFVKHVTADAQAGQLANQRRILTGNTAVDTALLAKLEKEDPTVHAILRTQIEHTDKMVGNWRTPLDSRIKEAFWPELQNALLGRKPAARALADAERRVQRELDRA